MTQRSIKFIQENLHHAKAASAILSRTFTKDKIDVALLQEPWTKNQKILGINILGCKLIYDNTQLVPRAAILVNCNAKFTPITEFIGKDIAAISLEVPTAKGNTLIYVASAYFPGDVEEVPPPEVAAFVSHCRRQNKGFIIGCDANAHHTIWSSTDINSRGESLFSFISQNDIDICNRGNAPTFINAVREEVLDLTLCNSTISGSIEKWRVSDEISLSDHRQILFEFATKDIVRETFRNPRKTNWELYDSRLRLQNESTSNIINTSVELEKAADCLTTSIMVAYNESCPIKVRSTSRDVPWWNDRLDKLRRNARKLFNRAKRTSNWSQYREALTNYNIEIRRSKRKNWRHMCESIDSTPETARLQKVLSKDHTNGLGTLKKNDGSFTENTQETLELMMETHFPGSLPCSSDQTSTFSLSNGSDMSNEEASDLADHIFTYSKIEWALDTFDPFKTPGLDGIFPIHLQKCKEKIIPTLLTLFKCSFLLRYIPTKWRQVRVVFIPKVNKKDKTLPKSFRPISLTSTFLKLMEKLIDEYIKSDIIKHKPLNRAQFAYQTGKSTTTALHSLVTKIEKTFDYKELLLAAFLDVEGAFDNASFTSMRRAMRSRGFSKSIIDWIEEMLSKREISAYLGDSVVRVRAVQGCPQGGVISPLLWSLVVDDLLIKLQHQGFEVIGFADDIIIIVRGKYDAIVSDRIQSALSYTLRWCQNEGLNVNPNKTTIVPFTKRRKISISSLKLRDVRLSLSLEVKFLGVILDSKLSFNRHVEQQIEKARNAFWGCKRTFGRKWGLKPRMILWIYTAIVRPTITYASVIWWEKTKQISTQSKLNKLQRLATAALTGAMRSTPSKALDAMLNLPPLQDFIQMDAVKNASRLRRSSTINDSDLKGHMSIVKTLNINPIFSISEDCMMKRNFFDHLFCVPDITRQDWEVGQPNFRSGSTIFFTDGSKQDNLVGAGISGPGVNVSLPLGCWPTVFQAEIFAILECADICLKRRYKNANICICSDSKAALNALKSNVYTSKLVWECTMLLQQLSCRNKVNLYWVPGHCGIEGNEKADQLAKIGSSTQFIGPEPYFGIAPCGFKLELKNLERTKIKLTWTNTSDSRQAKRFIEPDARKTLRLINLNKHELSTYTGLITGHCPSKYHLKIIGKLQEDKCRFCKLESESSEHLMCECVALYRKRCRYLEKGLLEPWEIWNSHPKQVLSFIRNAVPDWDTRQLMGG